MSKKRISFKVVGRVQGESNYQFVLPIPTLAGVNFRSFACKQANSMGITGWVTNEADGTVRGEAQGTPESIKEFIQHLEKGPSAARVTQLEHSDMVTMWGEMNFNVK